MKVVIQRVSKAAVKVQGKTIGRIGEGIVVLLGITHADTEEEVDSLVNKIVNLRIFQTENKYFEKSLSEIKGEALIVSQFTLYGSCQKGRRPDFIQAAKSKIAKPLYDLFVEKFKATGVMVQTGEFGADMEVELVNDGPVTLVLETP